MTVHVDVESIRAELEDEQQRLYRRARGLGVDVALGTWADSLPDVSDLGTAAAEREQSSALEAATVRKIMQVERALQRLDDGTYGTCEECGTDIDPDRLEVLPATTLCRTCR